MKMAAEPGFTILSILPLAHIFGQAFDFIFPFSKGCHIHIYTEKPIPAKLLKALGEVKPFMFLTVPLLVEKIFRLKVMPMLQKPVMRLLMSIPGIKNLLINKVRGLLVNVFGGNVEKGGLLIGGAAINKEVEDTMHKIKFPYVIGYGMTECAPLVSYTRWQDFTPHTCGAVARPYVDVRIDSEDEANIPGEILLKGDAVTTGYYKNPEATASSFTEDGWFRTGDMGTKDAKENIVIRGRCKNMILTANGQNIYPEEIEELINQLPLVLESLVVGRKHGLVALIVANEDAVKVAGLSSVQVKQEFENCIKELNSKLPIYSKITSFEIMDSPFEKTPKLSIKRFLYK
ncbi:MAG: AMP-binding protein [Bacteroidaceae bacterium]|nr:AMP-binding protein [Bacteroidaceae bacterium]